MRHGKKVNHLGRKSGHRKALMSNMASALIRNKRIETTLAKAKALRKYAEPLITKAKTNTTHSRRVVFSYLQDKTAVQELFDNIAGKIADRPGGYLRIIRIGFRQGDAAEMALIELVDYNETYTVEKKAKSTGGKKKRTRRAGKKSGGDSDESTPVEKAVETAGEVADSAVEATEEAVAAVEDTVEEVADTVEEAAAEIAEEVTPTAEASDEDSGEDAGEEEDKENPTA